jgi:hypothetical protein
MTPPRRERRNRERRSSSLYLQFVNQRTGQLIGDMADISAGGFRLESIRPIQPHMQFAFRIDVPPGISGQPFIKLVARSLWCRPDPLDSRLYDAGFEILSVDPGDRHALEMVIERYGSRMPGTDAGPSYR